MTSEQKALATILLHMRKMMITPGFQQRVKTDIIGTHS